jgi:hypothetical protein
MSNALQNLHPEVPLAQVGDDTISALTKLAEIFKNKFQKVQAPGLSNAPVKAAENKSPVDLSQPILTSPVKQQYQTRSQTIIYTEDTTSAPLLSRVVTPMTGRAAPPRVPTRSQNLSPRNLSQVNFWDIASANMAIALGTHHWYQTLCEYSCPPSHRQRNGIHGPHEGLEPATTLETRFWQRGRPPFSRHS